MGNIVKPVKGAPVGSKVEFLKLSDVTDDCLILNGSTYDPELYPELYALWGTTTLPDFRGCVVRGLDMGRGLDSGRVELTYQDDSFKSHTHFLTAHNDYGQQGQSVANSGYTTQPNIITSATGGTETRGKNMPAIITVKAK